MTPEQMPDPTSRVPPRHRKHPAREHDRDVDAGEHTNTLLAALMGFLVGGLFASTLGYSFLVGGAIGGIAFAIVVRSFLSGVARAFTSSLFAASGRSTPQRREYSVAESLVHLGDLPHAIAAYERHVADDPGDPEPYLRLAQLHRDRMRDDGAAERWFLAARRDATLDSGRELVLLQELVDLYLDRLHVPRKAIPELQVLIQRFPNTPTAQAAEFELRALRAMLAREQEGGPTISQQFLTHRRRSSLADS